MNNLNLSTLHKIFHEAIIIDTKDVRPEKLALLIIIFNCPAIFSKT